MRLAELRLEAQISPLPPVILGGLLVVPAGLLALMAGGTALTRTPADTQANAARARAAVMEVEPGSGSTRSIGRRRSSATTSRATYLARGSCGSSR
jgi:hypothetical protein